MKQLLILLLALVTLAVHAQSLYYVAGGDLSLVPAYEAAGDRWLDAEGKVINTSYDDGMITYVKEVAGWNAIRVRLFVDPTRDSDPATSQDLDYVKAFGARIKAAGLKFLLDLHYSDTWADPNKQSIPASWGFSTATSDAVVAQKVYDYTTEVLQALNAAAATPDYVQIGNEVSYGMLWRSKNQDFCNISSYNAAQWTYFATLLAQGSRAVREQCPDAKIVIHTERTANASQTRNIYTHLHTAGLADDAYDVIGLSYYPFWHGTLTQLGSTLTSLTEAFPGKEIQIVETAWNFNYYPSDATYASSKFSWPVSTAGQAAFLNDLIATLRTYPQVTGLYYWMPEECGNAADAAGNSRVMSGWSNRGFWELTWKSGQHKLTSKEALMSIQTFIPATQALPSVTAPSAVTGASMDLLGRRVMTPRPGQLIVDGNRKIVTYTDM